MTDKHSIVGVFSDEGPPVPIPNTVVKLISADNTWLEAAREDKAMPTQQRTTVKTVVFVFIKGKLKLSYPLPFPNKIKGIFPPTP